MRIKLGQHQIALLSCKKTNRACLIFLSSSTLILLENVGPANISLQRLKVPIVFLLNHILAIGLTIFTLCAPYNLYSTRKCTTVLLFLSRSQFGLSASLLLHIIVRISTVEQNSCTWYFYRSYSIPYYLLRYCWYQFSCCTSTCWYFSRELPGFCLLIFNNHYHCLKVKGTNWWCHWSHLRQFWWPLKNLVSHLIVQYVTMNRTPHNVYWQTMIFKTFQFFPYVFYPFHPSTVVWLLTYYADRGYTVTEV